MVEGLNFAEYPQQSAVEKFRLVHEHFFHLYMLEIAKFKNVHSGEEKS